MMETDKAMIYLQDVRLALGLLTRLPVDVQSHDRAAKAAWAFPLVGIVVGGVAATTGLLTLWLGLPEPLVALLALSVMIILSGAMHEDGLADTADGFWGGWTPERRLEIMKDSHIGSYGVLALILSLAARWSALWLLFEAEPGTAAAALIVAPALSRAMMPAVMAALPNARDKGLSHGLGRVEWPTAATALTISIVLAIFLVGGTAIMTVLAAGLVTLGVCRVALAKIGGQTGDVLGATQQLSEIAIFFCLVI